MQSRSQRHLVRAVVPERLRDQPRDRLDHAPVEQRERRLRQPLGRQRRAVERLLERDLVRPEMRIGWSVDEIESTGETLEFDMDPFEAAMWEAEQEDEDDE